LVANIHHKVVLPLHLIWYPFSNYKHYYYHTLVVIVEAMWVPSEHECLNYHHNNSKNEAQLIWKFSKWRGIQILFQYFFLVIKVFLQLLSFFDDHFGIAFTKFIYLLHCGLSQVYCQIVYKINNLVILIKIKLFQLLIII